MPCHILPNTYWPSRTHPSVPCLLSLLDRLSNPGLSMNDPVITGLNPVVASCEN